LPLEIVRCEVVQEPLVGKAVVGDVVAAPPAGVGAHVDDGACVPCRGQGALTRCKEPFDLDASAERNIDGGDDRVRGRRSRWRRRRGHAVRLGGGVDRGDGRREAAADEGKLVEGLDLVLRDGVQTQLAVDKLGGSRDANKTPGGATRGIQAPLWPPHSLDNDDLRAEDEGHVVNKGRHTAVVAPVLGHRRRRVHGAVFKVVGVLARREKPAGAHLGALEHRLGGAREDVVMALRAPHALVVLSRRELDDEAELLLHPAPKIDGLEHRRAVELHTHRLVAERAGVDHDRAKEGDPVLDGMRLDGLDVSVRGERSHTAMSW